LGGGGLEDWSGNTKNGGGDKRAVKGRTRIEGVDSVVPKAWGGGEPDGPPLLGGEGKKKKGGYKGK